MKHAQQKIRMIFMCAALVLVASACSGGSGAKVRMDVVGSGIAPAASMLGGSYVGNMMVGNPPATIDGFHCVAMNVVGPGIGPAFIPYVGGEGDNPNMFNGFNEDDVYETLANGIDVCTYPGVMSQVVSMNGGGVLEVNAPTGSDRLIQILGVKFKTRTECPSGQMLMDLMLEGQGTAGDGDIDFIAEVGRQRGEIFGDMSVDIYADFDATTAKDARCSGESTGGGGYTNYKDAVLASAPIGYWRMDEIGGNLVQDISESDFCTAATLPCDGSPEGGGLQLNLPGLLFGDPNNTSFLFWGGSGRINLGDEYNFSDFSSQDSAFSLEAWIRPTNVGGMHPVFGKSSPNTEYLLRINSGQLEFALYGDSGSHLKIQTSGTALTVDTSYHVVATYDGSSLIDGLKIYIDGTEAAVTQSSISYTNMYQGATQYTYIGKSDTDYFEGIIDEAAIFGRELESYEVHDHYIAGLNSNNAGEYPGKLDLFYGTHLNAVAEGRPPQTNFSNRAYVSAVQPDGKLIIAGITEFSVNRDIYLERFNQNGSLDQTFGSASQGWIGVVGSMFSPEAQIQVVSVKSTPAGILLAAHSAGNWYVARFSDNGLDGTFSIAGTPGIEMIDFSTYGAVLKDMAIDDDGSIWLVGHGVDAGYDRAFIVSLTTNGTVEYAWTGSDFSFGLTLAGSNLRLEKITAIPGGGFYFAGIYQPGASASIVIQPFTSNGSHNSLTPVAGFNSGNRKLVTFSGGSYQNLKSLAVGPDGRVFLAGSREISTNEHAAIIALDADGGLSPSFGTSGQWFLSNATFLPETGSSSGPSSVENVSFQAGYIYLLTRKGGGSPIFAVLKLYSNGDIDTSFGNGEHNGPAVIPGVIDVNMGLPSMVVTPSNIFVSSSRKYYIGAMNEVRFGSVRFSN